MSPLHMAVAMVHYMRHTHHPTADLSAAEADYRSALDRTLRSEHRRRFAADG